MKFSRSIGSRRDIKKGECIQKKDIIYRKPGGYLGKNNLKNVIGRRAKYDLKALNILRWEDIEEV